MSEEIDFNKVVAELVSQNIEKFYSAGAKSGPSRTANPVELEHRILSKSNSKSGNTRTLFRADRI